MILCASGNRAFHLSWSWMSSECVIIIFDTPPSSSMVLASLRDHCRWRYVLGCCEHFMEYISRKLYTSLYFFYQICQICLEKRKNSAISCQNNYDNSIIVEVTTKRENPISVVKIKLSEQFKRFSIRHI
jgi:hypothetical protein